MITELAWAHPEACSFLYPLLHLLNSSIFLCLVPAWDAPQLSHLQIHKRMNLSCFMSEAFGNLFRVPGNQYKLGSFCTPSVSPPYLNPQQAHPLHFKNVLRIWLVPVIPQLYGNKPPYLFHSLVASEVEMTHDHVISPYPSSCFTLAKILLSLLKWEGTWWHRIKTCLC